MPQKIPVNVQADHLQSLVATNRPMTALAEIIWNGFDADAQRVNVRFDYNQLDTLDAIRITDTGDGIARDHAESFFGNLGNSWKRVKNKTNAGRSLHGKSGKGRFKAFALGSLVEWNTTCVGVDGKLVDYSIRGNSAALKEFDLTDLASAKGKTTGTEVIVHNLHREFGSLVGNGAIDEIAKIFAVYLSEYPDLVLDYDGTIIRPSSVQDRQDEINLGDIQLPDGTKAPVTLTIIEWKAPTERALHLCDARGISLHEIPPGIQAPGFNFTAHLKSDYFRELDKSGTLILDELNTDVEAILKVAKPAMRDHFRARAAEAASGLVKKWKEEKIYPYEDKAEMDAVETAERQVFDILAVNVHEYLKDFDETDVTSRRFTFRLLSQAIKDNPESVEKILTDVLGLKKEDQDALAELLKKTPLSNIISSAQIVANRLNFLKGLRLMLFDAKEELLERDQLHKVLETETWLLGEHFALTNSDSDLEKVLATHRTQLGVQGPDDEAPVMREGGKRGRIDLMLARSVPQPRADFHEYLVVELKRPSQKVDTTVLGQIESYAMAVAQDERFHAAKTRWEFVVISNEMTPEAKRKARQRNRPEGLVFDDAELNIAVWAKTWSEVINDAAARHQFFKEKLAYDADNDSAKSYLVKTHEKYLPKILTEDKLTEALAKVAVTVSTAAAPTAAAVAPVASPAVTPASPKST
jgi:hypothetical protein